MKSTLLFLALAASLSGFAQVPGHVPADGLVAWYPFNGNALDESGNAANGTILGATPTEDRNGVSSAALHFDGQSWVSASPLGLPYADAPRSVSAWLNPSTVAGPFTLTAVAYGVPSTSGAFMVGFYNQGIAVQGWADDFGAEVDYNADEWMHVVCTYAASSIKIYLNGVLIEEGENTTWNTMDGPLILGSRVDLANSYFEGSIDDVGIWNRALDQAEVVALYNGITSVPGCTDADACNFSEEANVDDGSCIACSVFAERCGEGTIWDDNTQTCVVANPSDTDLDGCVGMTDLLDLLSSFGTCVEVPWACGDPLEYQDYNYETVQIGEQCWFAENLLSESYANGDTIPGNLNNAWSYATWGATAVYEELAANLETYGRLYNWFAVDDERGLCPSGWHVPTDSEWKTMEMALGMSEVDANGTGLRGTDQGTQMKTTYGWNSGANGTNSSGFSGLPGGYRDQNQTFAGVPTSGNWWCSAPNGSAKWYRGLSTDNGELVFRGTNPERSGFSVRCIQDAE